MAPQTRNGAGGSGLMISDEGGVTPAMLDAIDAAVSRAVLDAIPEVFGRFKAEVTAEIGARMTEMETRMTAAFTAATEALTRRVTDLEARGGGGDQPRAKPVSYRDFAACGPPTFVGKKDPLVSQRWISEVESAFRTSACADESRVLFAVHLLREAAKDWWDLMTQPMTEQEITGMRWDAFITSFRAEFMPQTEVDRVTREFMSLKQTTESVSEITRIFLEQVRFCPDFTSERLRMSRYMDMLRSDIREWVGVTNPTTLTQMIDAARARELELEFQQREKRQAPTTHTSQPPAKKSRAADDRGRRHDRRTSGGGDRKSDGSQGRTISCYRCGKTGHYSRECKETAQLCYNCNQVGHKRAECPSLVGQAVRAPAPATLQITDGRQGQAPAARGRAFQLTADEAKTAPDVVAGMFLIPSLFLSLWLILLCVRRYVLGQLYACVGYI